VIVKKITEERREMREERKQNKNDKRIKSYKNLKVYQLAMDAAMRIFELSKDFPKEEKYSLTGQIRRSSRSVCSNIAEAWRKRRYKAAFISKLSDSEAEAEETRVWLEFSFKCKYLDKEITDELDNTYDHILAQLVTMINEPEKWLLK
jgi:four helix bundle protein